MIADHESIEQPVAAPQAFLEEGRAAVASQAAFYLALGSLLDERWQPELRATALQDEFPLPWELRPRGERFTFGMIRDASRGRYPFPFPESGETWRKAAFETAAAVFAEPTPANAGVALELGFGSPEPLVRVAALISAVDHFAEPRGLRRRLVSELVETDDPVVADVATTALARWQTGQHVALSRAPGSGAVPPAPGQKTCLLVNGTMPPSWSIHTGTPETWWRPQGDLHTYLLGGSRPDVYAAPDFFEWEGGYSLFAHEVAAKNFQHWQTCHPDLALDVVTHSHGGNITMLATWFGLRLDRLVLLSCPVHWLQRQPCAPNVGSVQSIRIKFDLVILADRGGQRFPSGTIPEHVLPLWFISHGTTHKSVTWRAQQLDRFL